MKSSNNSKCSLTRGASVLCFRSDILFPPVVLTVSHRTPATQRPRSFQVNPTLDLFHRGLDALPSPISAREVVNLPQLAVFEPDVLAEQGRDLGVCRLEQETLHFQLVRILALLSRLPVE